MSSEKIKQTYICKQCGKEFYRTKTQIAKGYGTKFCSPKCYQLFRAKDKKTRKEIWTKYNQKPGRSENSRIWAEQKRRAMGCKIMPMTGINNPQWKGGISTENEKIRSSVIMKLWRRSVFERDNFRCQKYGIVGTNIQAHHINNFSEFPELRFAIDNGITLSEKAHKEFHHIYGRKNNTKEQLTEFITSNKNGKQ